MISCLSYDNPEIINPSSCTAYFLNRKLIVTLNPLVSRDREDNKPLLSAQKSAFLQEPADNFQHPIQFIIPKQCLFCP